MNVSIFGDKKMSLCNPLTYGYACAITWNGSSEDRRDTGVFDDGGVSLILLLSDSHHQCFERKEISFFFLDFLRSTFYTPPPRVPLPKIVV